MKKWIIAVLLGCSCLALAAGCSDNNATQQLESKIADLENKLNSATGSAGGSTNNASANTSAQTSVVPPASSAASPSSQAAGNNTQSSKAASYDLNSLTNATNEMVNKMNNAQPPNDFNQRRDQFYALKQEVQQVENQIDITDDKAEMDYRAGGMSYEEYRNIELQLDALDSQLDHAKDNLEYRFGIDN